MVFSFQVVLFAPDVGMHDGLGASAAFFRQRMLVEPVLEDRFDTSV